jgi:putative peptidoglycan lipid II flippase
MSALSLAAYSAGLPAFIAVKVLAPGFYARQDTRTPVKIAIIAMVSNMVLNLAFVASLLAVDFVGAHMGLALASSAAAYVNAGLLYRGLRRDRAYRPEPGWGRVLFSTALACLAMAAFLLWRHGDVGGWAVAGGWERSLDLGLLIGGGALVYGLALLLGGLRLHHLQKGAS